MTSFNLKSLSWAHPLVQQWFSETLGPPSEPQIRGWPLILSNQNTLISAPTGSGKTLAAFLVYIDYLVRKSLNGTLLDETEIVYVSPLKALVNDIQTNLLIPLQGILALAKEQNLLFTEINVAVRTGDTSPSERQNMLKKPPHILVTTPESLYILLTAEKSRERLRTVKTIIVDEIHALIGDKRGAHFALSMERLSSLTLQSPVRIGLSATVKPIDIAAHFLVGNNLPLPHIVNIGHVKARELWVETPSSELSSVASNTIWDEIYDRIAELIQHNRTTLIFANTRRIAERAAHHLAERVGKDKVLAHHGSLSRKLRLVAETKLKQGELKAVVATASLELGIDIGDVDLVCQLGSPRSIAVMLQRIGRAGHWKDAISKGILFATTRDELLECAALVKAILEGDLDHLNFPPQPLDILAQQIVASCATQDWHEDSLFHMVTQAFHYQHLTRNEFEVIINMLTDGIVGSRGRYGAYLFRDTINGLIKGRRGSRLTAITNGGAIPDNNLFSVIAEPKQALVGTLDEDFAVESNRGDIILLGSTSWKIKRIEGTKGRVLVEDAHGAPPSVPFWRGEAPERTQALSLQLSHLRNQIHELLPNDCSLSIPVRDQKQTQEAKNWLIAQCKVSSSGAEQIIEYILQGRAILGAVPTQKIVIAERFFDESGGMQLVIHSPFGARINKAWGLALRKRFCKSFNIELQAAATDNGIHIALTEQHSFPLADVFQFLNAKTVTKVLTQAVLQSPIFTTRWRWDAVRALAVLRFRYGKKTPPHILRMISEDVLAAVFPEGVACQDNLAGKDIQLPDHPLINETMKDALTEALDLEGLKILLEKIKSQEIQCLALDTTTPSTFSHEILNANPYAFLDDAPLEERRARAVEMRRILPDTVLNEVGKLDLTVINEVQQQAWPDIRNADELHDFLQTCIAYPALHRDFQQSTQRWKAFFDELTTTGRAHIAEVNEYLFWYATEKNAIFSSIYFSPEITPLREKNILTLLSSWMSYLGPMSNHDLAELLDLNHSEIEVALHQMESSGFVLRGRFKSLNEEWCERRLLARIHRYTLGKLRREIQPVSPTQFMRWLLEWQHVAPNTQLSGEHGLLEVIRQLQGFELPAKAWESSMFAKRIKHYDPHWLDRLCLMGIIGWGRLSPREITETTRVTPTSISPITFFIRNESAWLKSLINAEEQLNNLSPIAKQIYLFLQTQGASFFSDIVLGVHHLKSEVVMGLWELVTVGLTTADSFDNLRSLIDKKRRIGKKRHFQAHIAGRWSLFKMPAVTDSSKNIEAICWTLLKRYGVVFRDLIIKEKMVPSWRELLIAFRLLESRGEIRGGRFVDGFLGEQFALPYAVESLRAIKNKEETNEQVIISAADSLNLVGIILPGSRISVISGELLVFQNGNLMKII